MSRKDYIRIARAVNKTRQSYTPDSYARDRWLDDVARKLADELAADNGRFDRGRFLDACGVK